MRRSEQDQKVAWHDFNAYEACTNCFGRGDRDACIEKPTLPMLALQGTLSEHPQRGIPSKCLAIATL